jgi:hypothetical protein
MARSSLARINIYVPDPAICRDVKTTAAHQDLSISEYCLRAITAQPVRDGIRQAAGAHSEGLSSAVARGRRFQATTLTGRRFRSARLIREARAQRAAGA